MSTSRTCSKEPPRARVSLRHKLIVSAGVIVICTALVELTYRARRFGPAGLAFQSFDSVKPIGLSGLLRASEIPGLRYELKPNLRSWFKLVPFETNSLGMREREVSLEKQSGVFRIAVLGDSYTMGSGVRAEDVYSRVLERKLNAVGETPHYETLNFGVGGYGLADYLATLEHVALEFDPDLVIVGLCSNDAVAPTAEKASSEFVVKPVAHPFFRLTFVDDAFARRELTRRLAVAGREAGQATGREPPPRRKPMKTAIELSDHVLAYFRKIARVCRERKIALAIVYLADSSGYPRDRKHGVVFRTIARRFNTPYLDMFPLFSDVTPGELSIFEGDIHPNADAHARFAEALSPFLEGHGLLSPPNGGR